MKTLKSETKTSDRSILIGLLSLLAVQFSFCQTETKPVVAVISIETKGVIPDAAAVTYMVNLEIEKTNVYQVTDKYEIKDAAQKNGIDLATCLSKSCIISTAKILKADKAIAGSVERFGEKIVISLKLYDVKTETVEKTEATEYINLQNEIQNMVALHKEINES